MGTRTHIALLTALAAMGWVTALPAQEGSGTARPNTREGFFVGFGAGVGNQHFDPKTDAGLSESRYGPSLYLKLGGAASQSVILGAEFFGWADPESNNGRAVGSVTFFGQFYPSPAGAFFIKGGFGVATVEDNSRPGSSGDGDVEDIGFSGVIGVGYDWRIGKNTSLVPTIDLYLQDYNNFQVRIVNIGIGVMFH